MFVCVVVSDDEALILNLHRWAAGVDVCRDDLQDKTMAQHANQGGSVVVALIRVKG